MGFNSGFKGLSISKRRIVFTVNEMKDYGLSRYSDWLRAGRSGDRNPVGARFLAPVQTGPGAHPASCTMGTRSFPGVKSGRDVKLTPHPLLVQLDMKEYSYNSTPTMARTACTEPQCLYKGALYLYFLREGLWTERKYSFTYS